MLWDIETALLQPYLYSLNRRLSSFAGRSYTNLVALALFGVSRGVDVDLAVLQPCARLASLTLKSCRNISCIPPLPCLASFTVVSYGDLCMHFPPEGLPALSDLRLYGTKLTRCAPSLQILAIRVLARF